MIDINIVFVVLILTITTCYIQYKSTTVSLRFSLKKFDLIPLVETVNDVDLRGVDPALPLKLETCLTSWLALLLERKEFPLKDDSNLIRGF